MDPWLKLKFQKQPEIGIWIFFSVFNAQKCHLSGRLGIVRRKFFVFPHMLDRNKDTHCYLKCSTMDPWLKLKFAKYPEIKIWTFFSAFSV